MKEYTFEINGKDYNVCINDVTDDIADVVVNGIPYTVNIKKNGSKDTIPASDQEPKTATNRAIGSRTAVKDCKKPAAVVIKSPLPGTISSVKVKIGDNVTVGQTVAILEAMKMENAIEAEVAGVVIDIHVEKGDSLLEGGAIITIG